MEGRAELLPEELAAGSEDPEAQAAAILEESDERVADPEGTGADSTQTTSSLPDPALWPAAGGATPPALSGLGSAAREPREAPGAALLPGPRPGLAAGT